MSGNPWIDRFGGELLDTDIDQLVTTPASSKLLLGRDTPDVDANNLHDALAGIYLPTDQARQVLRTLLAAAKSRAQRAYPDARHYLSCVYEQGGCPSDMPVICITGLAGVGKTQLLLALQKVIGVSSAISIAGLDSVPLTTLWSMTLRSGLGLDDLLRPFIEDKGLNESESAAKQSGGRHRLKNSKVLSASRARAYRDGVCLISVDEFQFITQSANANARATQLLLNMSSVGPRLIYAANFSMIHRLKRRNHEERQRILACPIVLHPDQSGTKDWNRYLKEIFTTLGDVSALTTEGSGEQVYRYTFGIRRIVVSLLSQAYRLARRAGRKKLDGADLERAYRSPEFSIAREDVEALITQSVSGKKVREDLWCPYDGPQPAPVTPLDKAVENFEKEVEDKMLRSSLTATERASVKKIEGVSAPKSQGGNVVKMNPGRATKEGLLKGAKFLSENREKP